MPVDVFVAADVNLTVVLNMLQIGAFRNIGLVGGSSPSHASRYDRLEARPAHANPHMATLDTKTPDPETELAVLQDSRQEREVRCTHLMVYGYIQSK